MTARRALAAAACAAGLLVAAAPARAAQAVPFVPSVEQLLDWAEQRHPTLFPGRQTTQTFDVYRYRSYAATGNHVGVADGAVYVLGPVAGGQTEPLYVGEVADFSCAVAPDTCVDGRPSGSRWGVRRIAGRAALYDRHTGVDFVPRGFNTIRLAELRRFDGSTQVYHSTFDVGHYDAERADVALSRMAALGFNTTRVFLNVCCVGSVSDTTRPLNPGYVANLADFLRRAKAHGVAVIVTSDGWLPLAYPAQVDAGDRRFEMINFVYFSAAGVKGSQAFWTDLIQALRAVDAPLDNILAYSLANEAFADLGFAPFVAPPGAAPVVAANGVSYDVASPASRAALIEQGLLHYGDAVRSAIRRVDPTALVTMGFFAPNEPNVFMPGDLRVVPRLFPAFERSALDFVDVHLYPAWGISMAQQAVNYGIDRPVSKPLVMGEFGELKARSPTIEQAAATLRDWQSLSCTYGIKGWLMWTWDTAEQDSGIWWTGQSAAGEIAHALAPVLQPAVCP